MENADHELIPRRKILAVQRSANGGLQEEGWRDLEIDRRLQLHDLALVAAHVDTPDGAVAAENGIDHHLATE
ncbi:MAG: hypothetical protein VX815_02445 [Gemmatimonadota bacterium]|nr:hypothetical protein [Gemmatimonadota bacterium]